MEFTRGRGPFPTVMVRVEVPSDTKQEREMAVRGFAAWKICLTTHFKYQGNVHSFIHFIFISFIHFKLFMQGKVCSYRS